MPDLNLTCNWGSDFNESIYISKQVCALINEHNKLKTIYRPENIFYRKKEYILLLVGTTVLACIKAEKQSYNFTELKHLCVLPPCRKQNIGKLMVIAGLQIVDTPLVYAAVREVNIPSYKIFESIGFATGGSYETENKEKIIILLKRNTLWSPTERRFNAV